MNERLIAFLDSQRILYEEMVPLAPLTSFQTGGVARLLVRPADEAELSLLLRYLSSRQRDWFVLGKGSNLLAPDGMVDRVLIRLSDSYLLPEASDRLVRCGAGVSLMKLCRYAQSRGLSGLEFAFGIPGSVGGALFMNAGAYGGEIGERLVSACVLTADGSKKTLTAEEFAFGYRKSRLQQEKLVVTEATFLLTPDSADEIEARMKDFMGRRKEKQPLEYPSAGSTFKRPEGYYAGALIESCGLKGFSVGGAQVSEKHAGFCINKNAATTSDVLSLIEQVQKIVLEKTGVFLEPEVRLIDRV